MNKFIKMFPGYFALLFTWATSLLVGLTLTISAWNSIEMGKASEAWPAAAGMITRSEVLVRRGSEPRKLYSPGITYYYSVAGQHYEGQRIHFTPPYHYGRPEARAIVDHYPLGSTVTVYYDPADPYTALLEPGASGPAIRTLVLALVVGVVFGLLLPFGAIGYRLNLAKQKTQQAPQNLPGTNRI